MSATSRSIATRVAVACAVLSTLTLSGCETVAPAGETGVTVDANGEPVAVLAMCAGFVDRLILYSDSGVTPDPNRPDSADIVHGRWERSTPLKQSAAVSLVDPADGWTATKPLDVVEPGIEYVMYANGDNQWSTNSVQFTAESLAALQPGQVLHQTYYERTDSSVDEVIGSVAEFDRAACAP